MHAIHFTQRDWQFMLHGAAFLRYTSQDIGNAGERGARSLSAPNWIMAMAHRPVSARGYVMARAMMSVDRVTEGGDGYPLLLQTGETWRGVPLVDQQHPHDLFSELAVAGSYSLTDEWTSFVYFGLPGEPALGPTAFMHRPSARYNPDAPLAHHWQDATHITFGVFTAGLQYRDIKWDASVFTGREPDEDRYDFDKPRFDSYSGRVSINPTTEAAIQVSYAYIKSPEALEADVDVRHVTASVVYERRLAHEGQWSTTLAWGMNDPTDHENQHSLLLESTYEKGGNAVYTRAERVDKPASELGIASLGDRLEGISAFTLGAARNIAGSRRMNLMLGVQGTMNAVPDELEPFYGSWPASLQVYLVLSPASMQMGAGHAMPMNHKR
jgi:hypothetical protein